VGVRDVEKYTTVESKQFGVECINSADVRGQEKRTCWFSVAGFGPLRVSGTNVYTEMVNLPSFPSWFDL